MRIAIYSRKSVYTGKGESIENQIELCRDYIFSHIPDATEENIFVYEDEGFSGKSIARPAFLQMLSDSEKEPFNYLVCYRLDRISRSVSDFSNLINDLNNKHIAFVSIREQFDTSTPMGRAMMYIASVFAQLERETTAERVRDNMLLLAHTGRWLGGTTPTGFSSERVEEVVIVGKVQSSCKLAFNSEISIVKEIFTKFSELLSLSGVNKYLIGKNIKSRSGKYFSILGIREILRNPVYCIADKEVRNYFVEKGSEVCFNENECSDTYALISYNKRDYSQKSTPKNDASEWIIAKGKHKGIISGAEWIRIQNKLDENKYSYRNESITPHNDYSLLSGMIFCQKCGARMFTKSRHNKSPNQTFDYICNSKMRGTSNLCNCSNLCGIQTDEIVCDYLKDYMNLNSNIYKALNNIKNNLEVTSSESLLDNTISKISKTKYEIDNLIRSLAENPATPVLTSYVNQKVSELDETLKKLEKEKEELSTTHNLIKSDDFELEVVAKTLAYFKENFKTLSVQEKREILKLLIEKIEWDGKELNIFIYGE